MQTGKWRMAWQGGEGRGDRWCAGVASVELALLAPMLILLFTGVWDFGRALNESARLASAAHAGALYGTQSAAFAGDTDGIVQAVRNDAADTTNALQVVAQQVCQCPSGGEIDCTGSCGAGGAVRLFVQVQVTDSFQTLFPYPFVSNPMTLSKQATWRVN